MLKIYNEKDKNRLVVAEEINSVSGGKTDFREKMLLNNHIEGVLSPNVSIVNHEKIYTYDTEGFLTLEALCQRESIGEKNLKKILSGIATTVIKGEKYMLDNKDFILSPEHLFFSEDENPVLAYCPGYARPFREQMGNLAEYLMNRIDYHEQDAVIIIYTIYMKSREDGFGVRELQSFLENGVPDKVKDGMVRGEKVREEKIYLPERSRGLFDPVSRQQELHYEYNSGPKTDVKEEKITGIGNRMITVIITAVLTLILMFAAFKMKLLTGKDGKTDIMKCAAVFFAGAGVSFYFSRKLAGKNEILTKKKSIEAIAVEPPDEATELLFDPGNMMEITGCTLVSDSHPTIIIQNFPFYIGKDEEHMDYCLRAPGISRYHLKVDRIDGKITACDLNSTNGSYLNGEKLEPNRPKGISNGDEIRLGNCIYHVR